MTVPEMNAFASNDDLSATEHRLLDAIETGTLVDLRSGDADSDVAARGSDWEAIRSIRASVLVDLLTDTRPQTGKYRRYIKICGARITGSLNLVNATLCCSLLLQDCYIEEQVNLNAATAQAIRLPGCYLPALSANMLHSSGGVELSKGFIANGEVDLGYARITGHLDFVRGYPR